MTQRRPWLNWWLVALILSVYAGIAHCFFALRHPELTDTQRFLRFFDALLWR